MRPLHLALIAILGFAPVAAHAANDDEAACTKGQQEVAAQAKSFHGDEMMVKLIAADIERAKQEQAEGDADECLEALDHARKLLKGEY